jgi:hypothetical protein
MNATTKVIFSISAIFFTSFLLGCYWGGPTQVLYEQARSDLGERGYFERPYQGDDGHTGTLRFTHQGLYFIPPNSSQCLSKYDKELLSQMAVPYGGLKVCEQDDWPAIERTLKHK